jgi:hypothetical protein
LSPISVKDKVEKRMKNYGGEKNEWFEEWFVPTLAVIKIGSFAWEDLAATAGTEYMDFCKQCIRFNQPQSIAAAKK